jgi:chromatin remodeling complex protein RSC6
MSTETEVKPTETETEVIVDPMVRALSTMTELLDTLMKTSKSLTTEMKALTKDVNKLRLSKGKKQKRVINPDVPRKLGALEKPVPITEELAEFLGLTKGELYSRQQVTQGINKFVKDNDIQNPENRRYILLESEAGLKLKALLRDPDQPLTFFNIQRYLKVHYPKVESADTDTARSTTSTKSVDVSEKVDSAVVSDSAVVDETPSDDVPKKKVVRKVVKKVTPA